MQCCQVGGGVAQEQSWSARTLPLLRWTHSTRRDWKPLPHATVHARHGPARQCTSHSSVVQLRSDRGLCLTSQSWCEVPLPWLQTTALFCSVRVGPEHLPEHFPQGLVTHAGQSSALHSCLSAGRVVLPQTEGARVLSAPLSSACWQVTCLCCQPRPQEAEHLDQGDAPQLGGQWCRLQASGGVAGGGRCRQREGPTAWPSGDTQRDLRRRVPLPPQEALQGDQAPERHASSSAWTSTQADRCLWSLAGVWHR